MRPLPLGTRMGNSGGGTALRFTSGDVVYEAADAWRYHGPRRGTSALRPRYH